MESQIRADHRAQIALRNSSLLLAVPSEWIVLNFSFLNHVFCSNLRSSTYLVPKVVHTFGTVSLNEPAPLFNISYKITIIEISLKVLEVDAHNWENLI